MFEVDRSASHFRRAIARAAFASGAAQIVMRVLALSLAVAVARTLEPTEVGLLGLASVVVSMLSVIASCADTAGVTSRHGGNDTGYALVAVVTRGGLTVGLVGVTVLSLPVVSRLLAGREAVDVELSSLVHVLLWQLGFEVAATFPRVMLERRLDLTWVVAAGLVQVGSHVGLSLWLLWVGWRAVGIVVACVVGAALNAAVLWLRFVYQRGTVRDAGVRASVWRRTLAEATKVGGARISGYLACRVDNALVAGALGPTAMSFYGMAWTASRQPIGLFDEALRSVLTPTLAYIQEDLDRVGRALREALRHYYVLLVPLSAGLFVSGPSLVSLILGAKWLPLLPCLRVMCLTILVVPLLTGCCSLLMATGRAHLVGAAAVAQIVMLVITVPILSRQWGIVGAAFGDLAAAMVATVALWVASRRAMPGIQWGLVDAAGLPSIAGLISGVMAWAVGAELGSDIILRLLAEVVVTAFGYVSFLWCFGGRERMTGVVMALRGGVHRFDPAARDAGATYGV